MGKNNAKAWLSLAMIFALCLCIGGESIAATLRVGSSGEDVKTLQTKLKRWGYYTGSIDGVFGAGTKKAVIAFQKKNGLTPDGIVGAEGAGDERVGRVGLVKLKRHEYGRQLIFACAAGLRRGARRTV